MTTITAVRSGAWSDATTWDLGRIPDSTDTHAMIPQGYDINLDVSTPDLRYLSILGNLTPDPTKHIVVRACAIVLGHDATHDYTEAHHHPVGPMPGSLVAKPTTGSFRIQFIYFADMSDVLYPALVCSGAHLHLEGKVVGQAWVNLDASSGAKGDLGVNVRADADISKWSVNDRVIIVGCNNSKNNFADNPPSYRDGLMPIQTEEKSITNLVGSTVTFDTALNHWHKGRTGADGSVHTTELANLTRNVVVESADPTTTASRGHTVYFAHSSGTLRNVNFHQLGKEGRLGRYPIHFHHCKNTMRGFLVEGCSITYSHNKFISVHATNYITVRNNVGYRCYTSGFFLEDGTEVYNTFDGNLAVLCMKGAKAIEGEAIDYLSGAGFGFWWVNGRNTFINNVTAENDRFGYFLEIAKVSRYYNTTYTSPQHLTVPMLQEDGSIANIQVRNVRILRFDNNVSHNEKTWAIDFRGLNHSHDDPSIVRNFVAWSTHYPQSLRGTGVLFDGFKSINSNYGLDVKDNHSNGISNSNQITFRNVLVDGATVITCNMERAGADVNLEGLTIRSSTNYRGLVLPNHNWDVAPVIQVDKLDEDWVGGFCATNLNQAAEGKVAIYYFNDWFGPGQAAKVIHADHRATINDGLTYAHIDGLTKVDGNGVSVTVGAQVPNHTANSRPNEVDNVKPATAITSFGGSATPTVAYPANGQLTVRGIAIDKGPIAQVLVNGVQATPIKPDFSEWEAVIPVVGGVQTITAYAIDAAGNVEGNAHTVTLTVTGGSVSLLSTDDCYVHDGNPNTNFDGFRLVAKTGPSGYTRYSYLQFDLSNVVSVSSAKLRFSVQEVIDATSVNMEVYATASTWDEVTLTWNTRPAFGSQLAARTINVGDLSAEVDLTTAAQAAVGGILAVAIANTTYNTLLALNSKESTTDNNLKPTLLIAQ